MKILVIWDDNATAFVEYLRKDYTLQNGTELDQSDIQIINKLSELNVFLDNITNEIALIPDQIFILVDLSWNNKTYYGYHVATEIFKKNIPGDNGIDIRFVTKNISRDLLYENTKGSAVQHFLVKSFEHYKYPESTCFSFTTCSRNIWNYYRKHFLSKSLIISQFKHRLDSQTIKDIIPELLSIKDILNKNILSFIDSFNKTKKSETDKEELKYLLDKRANELNNEFNTLKETQKRIYNVLIIEDDEDWLKRLELIFTSRYESVKCYSSGQEALQELTDNSHRYDILVADLDLLDKNSGYKYNQNKMGFHLVEYAEHYCKHLAIRIITSLSSIGIDILFPQKNLKILPKRNFSFINEDYFEDLEKDVILAFKRNRNKKGPITNLWANINQAGNQGGDLLNYYYNNLTDQDREDIWQYAYVNIDNLHKIDGGVKPEEEKMLISKPIETVIETLKVIFTNRLYWITKYYECGGKIEERDPYFGRICNKNYTSQLGFKVLRPEGQKYIIVFEFLFNEEKYWLKNKEVIIQFEQTYLKETIDEICTDLNLIRPKAIPESYLLFLDQILNRIESYSEMERKQFIFAMQDFKNREPDEWSDLNTKIRSKLQLILN